MGKTAYVVEGYIPNGGTYMAYHVARILHLDYHYDVRVVTANPDLAEPHGHGRFQLRRRNDARPVATGGR